MSLVPMASCPILRRASFRLPQHVPGRYGGGELDIQNGLAGRVVWSGCSAVVALPVVDPGHCFGRRSRCGSTAEIASGKKPAAVLREVRTNSANRSRKRRLETRKNGT